MTEAETPHETTIRGEVVKRLRDSKGWTQGELAYHASVDQSLISRIEAGETTDVRLSTAKRLADALGVIIDELTGGRPPREISNNLPDFHSYVSRKFRNDPRLRQTLIQVYEAIESVKEERRERRRKRETERGQQGG